MPRALLLDDDAVQAAVYARLLNGRGFTSQIATDVREALDAVVLHPPDAILVHLGLPRNAAVDFIRTVRDLPQGREMRIFVLANAFLEAESLEAWEAGADQIVGKSTHRPEEILDLLVADVAGPSGSPAGQCEAEQAAVAEFLHRARAYVDRSRAGIERIRAGQPSGPPLDDFATCMRRMQAAQAFELPAIPQIAEVAEWLGRALSAWPSSVGPSSLRTLEQTLRALSRRLDAPLAPAPDIAGSRALAVDDDPTSRVLIHQAFRKVKLGCDLFESGPSALAAAEKRRYDLVVSDVMMPGMDGFAMVQQLRRLGGYEDVPVVYVTALDGFDTAFSRDPHGGTDVLGKPYLIMELAAKAVVHLMSPR
jgi:CheY-like chemotaxis protein